VSEFVGKSVAKAPPDIQWSLLSGLRHLRLNLSTPDACEESKQLVSRLLPYILIKDKGLFKNVQLEVLESAFLSVDFAPHEGLVEKARAVYKFLSKLAKSEELDGSAYRLMATILAHGSEEYFRKHAMTFVNKILLKGVWSSRRKDVSLEALLRLLRGRYVPHLDPTPFAFAPFRHIFPDSFKECLRTIFEALFGQKNVLPRISESLDICVEILLQIGAHSLTLLQSMITELVESGHVWYRVLALRTLRRMVEESPATTTTTTTTTTTSPAINTNTTATFFWSKAVSLSDYSEGKGNPRREVVEQLSTLVQRLFKGLSESLLEEVRQSESGAGLDFHYPLPRLFPFGQPSLPLPPPTPLRSARGGGDPSAAISSPRQRDTATVTSSSSSSPTTTTSWHEFWLRTASSSVGGMLLQRVLSSERFSRLQEKLQLTLERLQLFHTTASEDLEYELEHLFQNIVRCVALCCVCFTCKNLPLSLICLLLW
jgi:hypothetical protein